MKIDRAIENLTAGREDASMIPEEEYTQTIDLAIEAMKECQKRRAGTRHLELWLLPGETVD